MSNALRTIRREMARAAGLKSCAATTGPINPYGTRKATRGTYGNVLDLTLKVSGFRHGLARRLRERLGIERPSRAA